METLGFASVGASMVVPEALVDMPLGHFMQDDKCNGLYVPADTSARDRKTHAMGRSDIGAMLRSGPPKKQQTKRAGAPSGTPAHQDRLNKARGCAALRSDSGTRVVK